MPDPLHQQIADDLRAQITSGQLTPGQRLKSQSELSTVYTETLARPISRSVIRAAVSVLVSARLVEIRRGKGTFVVEGSPSDPPSSEEQRIPIQPRQRARLGVVRARIWPWQWRGDTAAVFSMAAQQPYLWLIFFTSQRSTFRGSEIVVVSVMIAVTAIGILLTIGDTAPGILLGLVYALSALTFEFSGLYWGYGKMPNFSVSLTRLDAIYFSVGTLTTAGTGDISATSELSRGLQTAQMGLDFALVVFAVAIVTPRLIRHTKRIAESDRSA
jgi:DNA-binding transcriptional regulator YhcF (GntR family)